MFYFIDSQIQIIFLFLRMYGMNIPSQKFD